MFVYCFVAYGERTGFTRLPDSGDGCPDFIQFQCISTGRGSASMTLSPSREPFFSESHAAYADPFEPLSLLNGDIEIQSLSRSTDEECFDELDNITDYCFTLTMLVQYTEQTMCRDIMCMTILRDGSNESITVFGNVTVSRETCK